MSVRLGSLTNMMVQSHQNGSNGRTEDSEYRTQLQLFAEVQWVLLDY